LDCDVPEDLSQRILSQLPEQTAAPADKRRPVIHWRKWGALAACVALVLWAGLTMPSYLRMGSSGSTGSAAPASGDTAYDNGTSAEEYSGGTDGTNQTTGDSPNDAAPAAIDPGADQSTGSSTADAPSAKTASLPAQYLSVTWTEDRDPAAQLIASADDLTVLLARFPEDDLTQVRSDYDDDFFDSGSVLIAVTLTEPSGSISHTAEAVRLTDRGYEVVIRRTVPEVVTDDMAAWLILIETDQGIGPSDEISVVFAP
jgi:hypothetical protein